MLEFEDEVEKAIKKDSKSFARIRLRNETINSEKASTVILKTKAQIS